jgi:hypothetical protein
MEDSAPYDDNVQQSRRVDARAQLKVPAQLVLLYGNFRCTIADVSRKGACILVDELLKVGDHGILQQHGLDQFFTVQWARDGRYGLCFEEIVPKPVILELRYLSDHYASTEEEQLREIGREWAEGKTGRQGGL